MVEKVREEGQGTAVLCSAGLDSVVLLAHQLRHGAVLPVYVSVGLAWEGEERLALTRILAGLPFAGRVSTPVILDAPMRDVYPPSHWALTGVPPGYDTPDEDVYLLGRNIVLLSKAGVLCAQRRIPRLAIGPLAGNPFPDATPEFFDAMSRTLSLGLGREIVIDAPFRNMTKADVIRLGASLGVPLELSLSCMRPEAGTHCGACSKCRERHDGFLAAGIPDPTSYRAALPAERAAQPSAEH